jgi:hypothetical protein
VKRSALLLRAIDGDPGLARAQFPANWETMRPQPPRPGSRRSSPKGGSSAASEIRTARTFSITEHDGAFGVVPLDELGRAVNLHPLGGATYPTRAAAIEAIRRYEQAEARARAAEEE